MAAALTGVERRALLAEIDRKRRERLATCTVCGTRMEGVRRLTCSPACQREHHSETARVESPARRKRRRAGHLGVTVTPLAPATTTARTG